MSAAPWHSAMEAEAAALAPPELGQPVQEFVSAVPSVGAPSDADGPGEVEAFFDTLPPEKQMPYILFMATDCIEGFKVPEVHPYSAFLANRQLGGKGGWMRKLHPGKDLVVQELKRRDPAARPNKSNKTVDEISQLFKPLTDPRDVAFVAKKEGEIRQQMVEVLEGYENERRARDSLEGVPGKRRRKGFHIGGNIEGGGKHVQPNGSLSYEAANTLMKTAEKTASINEWPFSIAVVDIHGNPIIVKRLQDASPASYDFAVGKAKQAAQTGKFTGMPGDEEDITRGGLPIIIDEVVCGGIGVSGAVSQGQRPAKFEQVAGTAINALKKASKSKSREEEEEEETNVEPVETVGV
ncbi:hypothetical protein ACHAXT_007547 [Thalassiosira profunda]